VAPEGSDQLEIALPSSVDCRVPDESRGAC
jgi:hypothetical protein